MATSDVDQLVEMGFDKERAQMAISSTGSLQNSLEWLEEHQDKSIEEIKESSDEPPALQPGEEARSLVCNDCGKKFRGQSQAEFHASKSGHVDFAESTEEIAPLTEEEKKQKLEDLRARLAEKRKGQSVQEKEEKKRNEEIRRKNTQASQDAKEELRKKEQMKQAAKKKIEMQEEIDAKKRIRAKIEADKEERRLRAQKEKAEREGKAPPPPPQAEPAPTTSGPVASKPASAYTETRLRLQTSNGNVMKSFPVDTTLFEVAAALNEESGIEVESFTQNFPKKVYNTEFFGETLKELGFVPSASLLVG